MALLLSHKVIDVKRRVQAELDGEGVRQTPAAAFQFGVDPTDAEIRWYLEDFLGKPVDPAPKIAARVESPLSLIGSGLSERVFGTRDSRRLRDRAQERLDEVQVAASGDPAEGAGLPWELLGGRSAST